MSKDNKALKAIQTEEFPSEIHTAIRPQVILRIWIKYGKHFAERATEQDK